MPRSCAEIEVNENWHAISTTMPWIEFPRGWKVQIIPPFAGATVRFVVENSHGAIVSVYADHSDALGVVGHPYWECYCVSGATVADVDDVTRLDLNNTEGLLDAISAYGDPVRALRGAP